MNEAAPASRSPYVAWLVVWGASLLGAVAIGIFVPDQFRVPWLLIAFGAAVMLSFVTQLWSGESRGFILRVGVSVLGALLLLGVVSTGFGLAALAPA